MHTTTIRDAAELEAFLLAVGTPGPTLNPDINSDDHWKRWNGWNKTAAAGVDADDCPMIAEMWHFASGHHSHRSYVRSLDLPGATLGSTAWDNLHFPLELLPPVPIIRHPDWTPPWNAPDFARVPR